MKYIRFCTISVLFDKQPTPKGNCCLYVDIWYLKFDIRSHVISCLRELDGGNVTLVANILDVITLNIPKIKIRVCILYIVWARGENASPYPDGSV